MQRLQTRRGMSYNGWGTLIAQRSAKENFIALCRRFALHDVYIFTLVIYILHVMVLLMMITILIIVIILIIITRSIIIRHRFSYTMLYKLRICTCPKR